MPQIRKPNNNRADKPRQSTRNRAPLALDTQCAALFGQTLRGHRTRLGITQEELAARSGVDRSHISDIERGANCPTLVVIYRLACGLDIGIVDLFEHVDAYLASVRRNSKGSTG